MKTAHMSIKCGVVGVAMCAIGNCLLPFMPRPSESSVVYGCVVPVLYEVRNNLRAPVSGAYENDPPTVTISYL